MGTDDSDGSASDQDPGGALAARLLDAATTLLVKGGTEAVTIDAVTKLAKVARATLYRHFDSGTELVAAAFGKLVAAPRRPPSPVACVNNSSNCSRRRHG